MNYAALTRVVSSWLRAALGLADLAITQVSLGTSHTQQGWHGSAKVYVRIPEGVGLQDPTVPFFLDFRVNHPPPLAGATPGEFHNPTQQLQRMGYHVLALNVTLENGIQLEVINEQLGRTV